MNFFLTLIASVGIMTGAPVAGAAPAVHEVTTSEARAWAYDTLEAHGMTVPDGVKLVFTSKNNCGAEASPVHLGGCTYHTGEGEYTVVISPNVAHTAWGNHILFHELGHTKGMGECGAEYYAHIFEGATPLWSYEDC